MFDLAPNVRFRRPSGPSGPSSRRSSLRLVWSQSSRPAAARPRNLLAFSLLCFFLGAITGGQGGLEDGHSIRRTLFGLFTAAGLLLLASGLVLLLLRRGHRMHARLVAAGLAKGAAFGANEADSQGQSSSRAFPQEELE